MSKNVYSAHHTVAARVWDDASKGFITVRLELDFDLGAIAIKLGQKAHRNKSGRTRLINGAILATVRK
jgi:hypothetical protein